MAVTYNLLDLQDQLRAIGRAVICRAAVWNGTVNLALTHLADTEGEITVATNEEYSHLTLTELTGPAKHESYVAGEDPVITAPMFFADPALRAIVSPTGNASGGYQRRRPVTKHTIVLFPEELFYNAGDGEYANLAYSGSAWTCGGDALTSAQEDLLGMSMWFWRCYFTKALPPFKHEDGGKAVAPVSIQVMTSNLSTSLIPDGQRLYTLGDPEDADIDIHPVDA